MFAFIETPANSFAEVALVLAVFLAVAGLIVPIARRVRLPPTVLLILIGFGVSEFDQITNVVDFRLDDPVFNDIVIYVLLPTLIFSAAREMSTRLFLADITSILTLAIPAFVISMVIVAVGVWWLAGIAWASAFVFGALISATDPVAVVDTFKRVGVPSRLETLVQGESVMNDGIAITLYTVIVAIALGADAFELGTTIVDFVVVFAGGAAVGLVIGFGTALAFTRLGSTASAALTIGVAYGAYALADLWNVSGVIATLTAALVIGAATPTVATPKLRYRLDGVWDTLDFSFNAILFLLLGFEVNAELIKTHWLAIVIAIGVALVSRTFGVFPLLPIVSHFAKLPRVSGRYQAVLIWGGLRGGVAVALALALPDGVPGRDTIIAMTFGVVLSTLVINSTTIPYLIRWLGLDAPTRSDRASAGTMVVLAVRAARDAMSKYDLDVMRTGMQLDALESRARSDLSELDLDPSQASHLLRAYGLATERAAAQELIDANLLYGPLGRVLLYHLDADVEAMRFDEPQPVIHGGAVRMLLRLEIVLARLTTRSSRDRVLARYSIAQGRLITNEAAIDRLRDIDGLAGVTTELIGDATQRFELIRRYAAEDIDSLRAEHPLRFEQARQAQAWELSRLTAVRKIDAFEAWGMVSKKAAEMAREALDDVYDAQAPVADTTEMIRYRDEGREDE